RLRDQGRQRPDLERLEAGQGLSANRMDLLLTLTVAFRALGRNKLRAGLTVLGVVIGIAAVTTMVSIGQSATALVQGQLQTLGTNVIVIFPATGRGSGVRDTAVVSLTAA